MDTFRLKYGLLYSARLLALIVMTVAGILLLTGVIQFVWVRHIPFLLRELLFDIVVVGTVFGCSAFLYLFLVRRTGR